MEKIAVISDIHGNIPALESVLQDIKLRGIEHINLSWRFSWKRTSF